jgi:hypothetical protein
MSEYKLIWKEGSFFEKGHWRLVPKDSGEGQVFGYIIYLIIIVLILCVLLLGLGFWAALLSFQMNNNKKFYAGIISFIGLIYFYLDMSNGWLTKLVFHGDINSSGEFNDGIFGFNTYQYFLIANYTGFAFCLCLIVNNIIDSNNLTKYKSLKPLFFVIITAINLFFAFDTKFNQIKVSEQDNSIEDTITE